MVQDCPPGYILRKGYTRKFSKNVKSNGYTVRRKGTIYTVRPKANEISVAASCIKERGLPGKGPNSIGKLR